MSKIEQTKAYTGTEMEKLFFRPILSGPAAESLGIRVMYNMPVPTTLNFWRRDGDILQKFGENGWCGSKSDKVRKTIDMTRVKAEMGYSAADYFSLVSEQIMQMPEVNMQDLSGTELEYAETELFKQAIADSIRNTMWIGNTERSGKYNTFDGILTKIYKEKMSGNRELPAISYLANMVSEELIAEDIFGALWNKASSDLRELKGDGHLAIFVTSDCTRHTKTRSTTHRSKRLTWLAKTVVRSCCGAESPSSTSRCTNTWPILTTCLRRWLCSPTVATWRWLSTPQTSPAPR